MKGGRRRVEEERILLTPVNVAFVARESVFDSSIDLDEKNLSNLFEFYRRS